MTGQLARSLPDLSRFAVMQHLSVLESAGLVLARREGRTRLNYVNPAPIRQIYERWIDPYASTAAETALRLKRYAEITKETDKNMNEIPFRVVEIELELRVDAPIERVYKGLTEDLDAWWPHRYKPDSTVYAEPFVGGKIGERFKNGGGALYGEVLYLDPPTRIAAGGSSMLNRGHHSMTSDVLEPTESGGTLVKRSFRIWGQIPPDAEQMYRGGVGGILQKAFAEYIDRGVGYVAGGGE